MLVSAFWFFYYELLLCNISLFLLINSHNLAILSSEMMLLGFISLLLTATPSIIVNICIPSKFYNSAFAPCSKSDIDEEMEKNGSKERKLLMPYTYLHLLRRMLNDINMNSCKEVWPICLKCFKIHYCYLLCYKIMYGNLEFVLLLRVMNLLFRMKV